MTNKRLLIASVGIFVAVSLNGCGGEKTHTVDEFMADKKLLDETMRFCKETPDRLSLPNCINAGEAQAKQFRCKEFKKAC